MPDKAPAGKALLEAADALIQFKKQPMIKADYYRGLNDLEKDVEEAVRRFAVNQLGMVAMPRGPIPPVDARAMRWNILYWGERLMGEQVYHDSHPEDASALHGMEHALEEYDKAVLTYARHISPPPVLRIPEQEDPWKYVGTISKEEAQRLFDPSVKGQD